MWFKLKDPCKKTRQYTMTGFVMRAANVLFMVAGTIFISCLFGSDQFYNWYTGAPPIIVFMPAVLAVGIVITAHRSK